MLKKKLKKLKFLKAGLSALLLFAGVSPAMVNAKTQTIAMIDDVSWIIYMTDMSKITTPEDDVKIETNGMDIAYSLTLADDNNFFFSTPTSVEETGFNSFSEYTQAEASETNLRKAVQRNDKITTSLTPADMTIKDKLQRALQFGYPTDKNKIFDASLTNSDKYIVTQLVIDSVVEYKEDADELNDWATLKIEDIYKDDEAAKMPKVTEAFNALRTLVFGNEDASSVALNLFNSKEAEEYDLISTYVPSEKATEPTTTDDPTGETPSGENPGGETPTGENPTDNPVGEQPQGDTYTITFDANGGEVSDSEMTIEAGKALESVPEAVREGYRFDGWYTAQTDGDRVNEYTVPESDLTVYAHWTAVNPTEPGDEPVSDEPTGNDPTGETPVDDPAGENPAGEDPANEGPTGEEPVETQEFTNVLISVVNYDDVSVVQDVPLSLEDAEGNEIEKWSSSDTAHRSDLRPGQYVLKVETPAGYIELHDIEFTVTDEGEIVAPTVMQGVIFVELTKIVNAKPKLTVNDQVKAELQDGGTPIIFKVAQMITEGSKTVKFSDNIPEELEIVNASVTLKGMPEDAPEFEPEIKIENNEVSFVIENIQELGANEINVQIETKLKDTTKDASLSNIATVVIDGTTAESDYAFVEYKVPVKEEVKEEENEEIMLSSSTRMDVSDDSGNNNSNQQNTQTQQAAKNATPNTRDHGLTTLWFAFFSSVILGGCALILRLEEN